MSLPVLAWFSCERDYALLAVSIAAARELWPTAPAVVFLDQSERQLPAVIEGVDCHRTSFPRGGNLTDQEAPAGIAKSLVCAMVEHAAEWVIKIDSDTLLLRTGWAARVADGFAEAAGWRLPIRPGLGAAYALSARAARHVADSFADVPALTPHEDAEILGRACLWACATGRATAIQALQADPLGNSLRQYRPATWSWDSRVEALHFGRIPDAADQMKMVHEEAIYRSSTGC